MDRVDAVDIDVAVVVDDADTDEHDADVVDVVVDVVEDGTVVVVVVAGRELLLLLFLLQQQQLQQHQASYAMVPMELVLE